MDGPTVGLIGGIAGGVIGVLGAVIGTWCSLRAARSEAERRYLLRWAAGGAVGIAAFLVVLFLLPPAYRPLAFVPYALVLGWAIRKSGVELARLRAAEERRPA